MEESQVTLVVVPRERFSAARVSLESIYAHTRMPFSLVYVDGGSPRALGRYLAAQALLKGFQLIRTESYLTPNRARNLGLREVHSKYVVFIDNDVVVTPGWLDELLQCAEATRATIVSPLICQGEPVHEVVHCAGGESSVVQDTHAKNGRRHIIEKIYRQGECVADIYDLLERAPTGLAEFHCMLVRTAVFDELGSFDTALLNTKEHVDFCLLVAQAGGSIYLEPKSVVTYLFGSSLKLTDVPFYALRWSDAWEQASLQHLRDKWDLAEDDYFTQKYRSLGWRRQMTITGPLSRVLTYGRRSRFVEKILTRLDKVLNRYFTSYYAKRFPQYP